jgi:hypothetical protein
MADLGLDMMNFSLDSKVIVDAFNDNNDFGSIICHCKHLLRDSFNNSTLEFSRRQANGIANELAQGAPSEASSQLFIDVPPVLMTYYLMK